jgi:hypothetical protein
MRVEAKHGSLKLALRPNYYLGTIGSLPYRLEQAREAENGLILSYSDAEPGSSARRVSEISIFSQTESPGLSIGHDEADAKKQRGS